MYDLPGHTADIVLTHFPHAFFLLPALPFPLSIRLCFPSRTSSNAIFSKRPSSIPFARGGSLSSVLPCDFALLLSNGSILFMVYLLVRTLSPPFVVSFLQARPMPCPLLTQYLLHRMTQCVFIKLSGIKHSEAQRFCTCHHLAFSGRFGAKTQLLHCGQR